MVICKATPCNTSQSQPNKAYNQINVYSNAFIRLYYQNARSICNKLSSFNFFSDGIYDIIAITKTWLHSGVCDSEILHENYIVYRKIKVVMHMSLPKLEAAECC